MQPFPIPFEPLPFAPCQSARSRLEKSTRDTVNARHVEMWETDAPSLTNNRKPAGRDGYFDDMLPIASRTYKEDMKQWASFKPPSTTPTNDQKEREKATATLGAAYRLIQQIDTNKAANTPGSTQWNSLQAQRLQVQEWAQEARNTLYRLDQNALSDNPYFSQYDIASDSRNVIRELNAAVVEDKTDRGIREDKRLLNRIFQSRWVEEKETEKKGYDTLGAYELMRPALNDMSFDYRARKPN